MAYVILRGAGPELAEFGQWNVLDKGRLGDMAVSKILHVLLVPWRANAAGEIQLGSI